MARHHPRPKLTREEYDALDQMGWEQKRAWWLVRTKEAEAGIHITDLMFRDSTTARMLRRACMASERGEDMTQADFMREYHRICARPCRHCNATGLSTSEESWRRTGYGAQCTYCKGTKIDPQRSSFKNNFGRFDCDDEGWNFGYRCFRREGRGTRATYIVWCQSPITKLLAEMKDAAVTRAFELMEYQMLNPRPIDDVESDLQVWVVLLRDEIARRAATMTLTTTRTESTWSAWPEPDTILHHAHPKPKAKRPRCPKCGGPSHRCKTGECRHCNKCEHAWTP